MAHFYTAKIRRPRGTLSHRYSHLAALAQNTDEQSAGAANERDQAKDARRWSVSRRKILPQPCRRQAPAHRRNHMVQQTLSRHDAPEGTRTQISDDCLRPTTENASKIICERFWTLPFFPTYHGLRRLQVYNSRIVHEQCEGWNGCGYGSFPQPDCRRHLGRLP